MFVVLHSSLVVCSAHPADVSQLRVKVAPQQLEFRLTLNVFCLQRMMEIDGNRDGRIARAELEHAEPAVRDFLLHNVLVTINDVDTNLGTPQPLECLWPNSRTAEISEPDFPQRFIDFVFVKPWPSAIEDVWIGFDTFDQLGEQHTVQAVYQQDGAFHEVGFSLFEPEYLYDTGYASQAIKPAATERSGGTAILRSRCLPLQWSAAIGLAAIAAGTFIRIARAAKARKRGPWQGFLPRPSGEQTGPAGTFDSRDSESRAAPDSPEASRQPRKL